MKTTARQLVFDRGTILFAGSWPQEIASVPRVLLDPRVGAFRAPAYAWAQIAVALRERGIDCHDGVRSSISPTSRWQPLELRPYQEEALRAWDVANRRGLVVLPTGAGKTRVALAAIARCRTSALCIAPTRVLLEQWRNELSRVYRGPPCWTRSIAATLREGPESRTLEHRSARKRPQGSVQAFTPTRTRAFVAKMPPTALIDGRMSKDLRDSSRTMRGNRRGSRDTTNS